MKITALKSKRQEKGITQEALASESNLLVRTYQRYEAGERLPDVHTAIRLADGLEIETYDDFRDLFPLPTEASLLETTQKNSSTKNAK